MLNSSRLAPRIIRSAISGSLVRGAPLNAIFEDNLRLRIRLVG